MIKDPIVIVSATRIPMGHYGGYFKETPSSELGAAAIKSTVEPAKLEPENIDEAIMGYVLSAGQGQAPARQAAIKAGLPPNIPCSTVNKMYDSGMKAIMLAHDGILASSYEYVVAGGIENMSVAPYLLMKARFSYRLGHNRIYDHMMLDGLGDAYDRKAMGVFAEKYVDKYQFSRKELDDFALTSLTRAKKANEDGTFSQKIIPITVKYGKEIIEVIHDGNALKDNPEKIPHLKPAFKPDRSVTAANSRSISDGAAALILMRLSEVKKLNIRPMAKIVGHFTHAQEPAWFTTVPIKAIQLIRKNWLEKEEVDLFEINKAFAAVTMPAMKEIGLPHKKLISTEGLVVLGHPIGTSSVRIMVILLYAFYKKIICNEASPLYASAGEKQQPLQLKEKLFKTHLTLPLSFLFGGVRVSMRC